MVGRKVDQLYPDRARRRPATSCSTCAASRGAPRVKERSFEVRAGEVVGIGGLVGAGRTELLRLIYGLDRPDTGEVHLDGKQAAGRPPGRRRSPPASGLAPEDRKSQGLLLGWSLAKNVSARRPRAASRRGLLISLRGRAQGAPATSCASSTPCPDDPDRIARELSGGNQQKVVLARWLLRQCKVLLLDEPTRGVDVGAKAEIYKLIADLAQRGHRASSSCPPRWRS